VVEYVILPRLSQEMEQGRITEWLKAEGEPVEEGEALLLVETNKALVEVQAPCAGILRQVLVAAGEDAAVGARLGILAGADELIEGGDQESRQGLAEIKPTYVSPHGNVTPAPGSPGSEWRPVRRPSSPAARRAAGELGIDLTSVEGTGADGIVTEADVRGHVGRGTPAAPDGTPSRESDGEIEIIPLTARRTRIAERLSESVRTVASVTTVIDVDVTDVAIDHTTTGSSYTAYVVWAAARALREFPVLNASLEPNRIVVRRNINLGVAVALEDGLVVPVIRSADTKTVAQISNEIGALANRARLEQLRPEDMTGGTFTVTNSGGYGSLLFTPIINLPEVAILGMGRVADAPVVREGQVAVRKVMLLCLTYDHRAIDGATAVSFLSNVKKRLEGFHE
jgi:pyruvate/2-oxoglutarate dehydrogenase complex dihydrolipoamide acyltransferase (E2) component